MEVARSSFYAEPAPRPADGAILARITAICDEYPAYGYRRVGAELRHRGLVVNAKKVRRLMAENGLNPKRRRRYAVTTDSNHDGPIFANIAKGFEVHGSDQLWDEPLSAWVRGHWRVTSPTWRSRPASSISRSFSTPGHAGSWATPSTARSTPGSPRRR